MIDIDDTVLHSSFPAIGTSPTETFVISVPSTTIQNFPAFTKVTTTVGTITGDFVQIQANVAPLTSGYLMCDTVLTDIDSGSDTFTFRFYFSGTSLILEYSWFTPSGAHASTALTITAKVFVYKPIF
jgi:hypothetical protein